MNRSSNLKLGIFVATALAALAGLIIVFGGAPRLFDQRARYLVTFSEAPGLNAGTPVRKSGVRIGEVAGLELDPETGKVMVSLRIDRSYLPRVNEEPTITSGLLSGDTTLDFVPKTGPDGQPVAALGGIIPPDSTIVGVTPINLVRQASGVLPSAQESMVRILDSLQRFEQLMPKIEKAFDEVGLLAQSGREFLPEIRQTNQKVQSLLETDPNDPQGMKTTLKEINEFVRTARPFVEDMRRLLKTNEEDVTATIKSVRQTSESVNDLLNEENRKSINAAIRNIEASSEQLTKTIQQASTTLERAEKTLTDASAAVQNIEKATKPLAENSEVILKNVNAAAEQLTLALGEARLTLTALNRNDGTLQRLISDPALFSNLNSSAAALTRTLLAAEKIAFDLQVFSDKIARRPELIGVGGALRPSSGLKDPPHPSNWLPPSPLEVPSFRPSEPIAPTRGDLPP